MIQRRRILDLSVFFIDFHDKLMFVKKKKKGTNAIYVEKLIQFLESKLELEAKNFKANGPFGLRKREGE